MVMFRFFIISKQAFMLSNTQIYATLIAVHTQLSQVHQLQPQ